MKTSLVIIIFSAFSIVFSLITGFLFSYLWVAQIVLWVLLSAIIYYLYFRKESKHLQGWFFRVFGFYLIFESILKILLSSTENTWVLINTLEHFIWSLYFAALIYYPLFLAIPNSSKLTKSLVLISVVSLVGVMNEQLEYILRSFSGLSNSAYYFDTIRDVTMNMLGAFTMAIAIFFKSRKHK